jgi:hypothetical protein
VGGDSSALGDASHFLEWFKGIFLHFEQPQGCAAADADEVAIAGADRELVGLLGAEAALGEGLVLEGVDEEQLAVRLSQQRALDYEENTMNFG